MPYLKQDRRKELDAGLPATCAGDLNYQITCLFLNYLKEKGTTYQSINDCMGAVEGAKMELYRVVAAPYEDGKVLANGGVYPSQVLSRSIGEARPGTPQFVAQKFIGKGQLGPAEELQTQSATKAYQAAQSLTDR